MIKDKPKIIIIEGCDKTGKSTLADKIAKHTGYKLVHLGVPKDKQHFEYLNGLLDEHKDTGVVFDRFHWGDPVYAGITNDGQVLNQNQFSRIESRLVSLGAIIIYCYDNEQFIAERFASDKEELIDPEYIPIITGRYDKLLDKTMIPTYLHNQEKHPFILL